MTEDQLKAFWEHIQSNQDIQNALKDLKILKPLQKLQTMRASQLTSTR